VAQEHEKLLLSVIPLNKLWQHTSDAKALCALHLFEKLTKEGKLP
jgi:hypothetical protein